MSSTVTLMGAVAMSSLVVTFATFEIVGASLALVTVTTNMSVTDSPDLLWNVTPILAVPDRFAAGVTDHRTHGAAPAEDDVAEWHQRLVRRGPA